MPLDIKDVATIADLPRSDYWRSLARWLSDQLAACDRQIRTAPQTNDEDYRRDIKWLLSRKFFIEEILNLPEKIKESRTTMED